VGDGKGKVGGGDISKKRIRKNKICMIVQYKSIYAVNSQNYTQNESFGNLDALSIENKEFEEYLNRI
jgi:hypothetical protein